MEQFRKLLCLPARMQVDAFLQQYQIYDYTDDDLSVIWRCWIS